MKKLGITLTLLALCFNLIAVTNSVDVKDYYDIQSKLKEIKIIGESIVEDAIQNWKESNLIKKDTTKDMKAKIQLDELKKQYTKVQQISIRTIDYQMSAVKDPLGFLKKKKRRKKMAILLNEYLREYNKLVALFEKHDSNYNVNRLDAISTIILVGKILEEVYKIIVKLTEPERILKAKAIEKLELSSWKDLKVKKSSVKPKKGNIDKKDGTKKTGVKKKD